MPDTTAVRGPGPEPDGVFQGMEYSLAVTRIQRFLEEEAVVWLSTVRPDGTPHIVPVWFWWDGDLAAGLLEARRREVRRSAGRARP